MEQYSNFLIGTIKINTIADAIILGLLLLTFLIAFLCQYKDKERRNQIAVASILVSILMVVFWCIIQVPIIKDIKEESYITANEVVLVVKNTSSEVFTNGRGTIIYKDGESEVVYGTSLIDLPENTNDSPTQEYSANLIYGKNSKRIVHIELMGN
ncbi:MAG: hypothetical protein IKU15_08620 [Clostridia bacterium]|nr:hypothetical protein [Clostridia bacterium]